MYQYGHVIQGQDIDGDGENDLYNDREDMMEE